jgi:sodium-coupled neutral amino acid transporter 11
MGVIVITILTQGPRLPADMRGQLRGSLLINDGVFQAIGVISFAFVCHHNSLLIYGSLRKPTMDRFARVTHYSTAISMVACLSMALGGYITFGDMTKGNVLNNFPTDNIMVNVARLCFGLNMITTLPLECFVCREVMTEYYFPGEPHNPNRHLIFTTSLVVSAMTLSLITCDIGVVFELVGATSACALAYILPPLCFVKLTKRKTWETYASYACIAFGCIVMVISLLQAITKMVKGKIRSNGTLYGKMKCANFTCRRRRTPKVWLIFKRSCRSKIRVDHSPDNTIFNLSNAIHPCVKYGVAVKYFIIQRKPLSVLNFDQVRYLLDAGTAQRNRTLSTS